MRNILRTRLGLAATTMLTAAVLSPAVSAAEPGGITPSGESAGADAEETDAGVFPIRAPHTYGEGLGAGRGHQGQDLLARCGKPVVAAQPGRVIVEDYQASGAGNFVVIKGRGPRYDYVYMHLLGKLEVSEGDRVEAGDPIGLIGSTGRSTACQLHFEMWTAPGWYSGGEVANPTPFLKLWDRKG